MLGLDVVYMYTKFDHQNLDSSRDLTMPLSGMICHSWASTCSDQPNSLFIHYEDIKGDTKYQKLRGLG